MKFWVRFLLVTCLLVISATAVSAAGLGQARYCVRYRIDGGSWYPLVGANVALYSEDEGYLNSGTMGSCGTCWYVFQEALEDGDRVRLVITASGKPTITLPWSCTLSGDDWWLAEGRGDYTYSSAMGLWYTSGYWERCYP